MDIVSQQTRDYELMAILIPDMAEEDNQAQIDRVNSFITDAEGQVKETLTDSPWGRRRLAYTIRHEGVDYRDGFYVVIHFSAAPNRIADMERELKLDTSVIRYLLVMDDPKAGEKITQQPEAPAAEQTDEPTQAPAEEPAPTGEPTQIPAEEPQVADEVAEDAAEETPVDAPVSGTEAAVVETAEAIEGEEEPAPANGGAASEEEA